MCVRRKYDNAIHTYLCNWFTYFVVVNYRPTACTREIFKIFQKYFMKYFTLKFHETLHHYVHRAAIVYDHMHS